MDPKKLAIEELMSYLDQKDGEELGEVVKPKAPEVEAVEAEGVVPEVGGEEIAMSADAESSEPKMSPEEMEELIEALQSKLGG